MYQEMQLVRCPRALTAKERRIRDRLMRRKFYDCNQPNKDIRHPILFRAFVAANHQGHPIVLLLCQISKPNAKGKFNYCLYSDGLYGKNHWASDSYGFGNLADARAAFKEHLVQEVIGIWSWVIDVIQKEAKVITDKQRRF